jgi:hypothetical protein
MLRGKDAMWVEDSETHLTITAKLADGAQLGRQDRCVFKRTTIIRRPAGVRFRVAIMVVDSFLNKNFPKMAQSAKLNGELEGLTISVEDGTLRAVVPVTTDVTEHWTRARQGDTAYKVVHFFLPNDPRLGSVGEFECDSSVEICVSHWTPEGATEAPAWILDER